ncbi:MAG TPA: WD40 repeat domain-containing protein [Urbifossiella sp.]|jgi:WD40 repeat protein|nr:WD40 repeat domain-containing protein [Urbifossiella sp.]
MRAVTLVALVVLAGATTAADPPAVRTRMRVAVVPFQLPADVAAKVAGRTLDDLLLKAGLDGYWFRAVAPGSGLEAVFERRRQEIVADPGEALKATVGDIGADAVLIPSVSRVGGEWVGTAKWVDARTFAVRVVEGRVAGGDEKLTDLPAALWRAADAPPLRATLRHRNGMLQLAFRPDGKRVFTLTHDNDFQAWDAGGRLEVEYTHTGLRPSQESFKRDGNLEWDSRGRALLARPDGSVLLTAQTDASPTGEDGSRGAYEHQVRDALTGRVVRTFRHNSDWVHTTVFSPADDRIAYGSCYIFCAVDPAAPGPDFHAAKVRDKEACVKSVAFSPDGKLLAGVLTSTARVVDAAGATVADFPVGETVRSVAFSFDGKVLATATNKGVIRFWDVAGKKPTGSLDHPGGVAAVAFSPDGKLFAAGCEDKTARVWELATGRLVATLPHDGEVGRVVFSPDGKLLATISTDKLARLWDLAP